MSHQDYSTKQHSNRNIVEADDVASAKNTLIWA